MMKGLSGGKKMPANEGIFKRHICNVCKKKLYEKDMQQTDKQTRYGKDVWICFKCIEKGRSVRVY